MLEVWLKIKDKLRLVLELCNCNIELRLYNNHVIMACDQVLKKPISASITFLLIAGVNIKSNLLVLHQIFCIYYLIWPKENKV